LQKKIVILLEVIKVIRHVFVVGNMRKEFWRRTSARSSCPLH